MAKSYLLEIITPERLFYMGEVEQIIVRTLYGDEGFLAGHTWACKLLATGELWIREPGTTEYKVAALSGGFIDVRDSIVIYADSAEWPEEIDEERAQKAREKAAARLSISAREDADMDVEEAKLAILKSTTRINIKMGGVRRKK